jgi:integrase
MVYSEKLTSFEVERISKPGRYNIGERLFLQITETGVKSWIYRYKVAGREYSMGFGTLQKVSLRQARHFARRANACLARGADPLQERKTVFWDRPVPYKISFNDCIAAYISIHQNNWKSDKHRKQWESTLLSYVSPCFGDMDVREISTTHILDVLEPIWMTKVVTASRLRERIQRVLSWATTRGFREDPNPARWEGHLQELLPRPSRVRTVQHHLSMSYTEMRDFCNLLKMTPGIEVKALVFTILTACRTGEALGAKWEEFDLLQRIWIIPAARMKSGRPHDIPLSDAVLDILKSVRGMHPTWVFPNKFPNNNGGRLHDAAMLEMLKKMKCFDATVHGFRSSFRVWAAEQTAYPNEIAELALAHRAGSFVEKAYQRSNLFEIRRALMQDWAVWCGYKQARAPSKKPRMVTTSWVRVCRKQARAPS